LAAQLAKEPLKAKRRVRNKTRKHHQRGSKVKHTLDASTLASVLQLQEQHRELMYSIITLIMKVGVLAIFSASLVKLGISSHQRVRRHIELVSVLGAESKELEKLNYRFDRLFTIGGDRRLMDDQDHWIAPNSVRVIWR
tara:strand:+ start:481 stop:897 length:417 start_codon:yes stop_codon:yes gene_type:complete